MAQKEIKLVDVERPNLFRDIFPYSEFPRVTFDNQAVPYDIPDDIWITDTTFRDGQQARPPYKPDRFFAFMTFSMKLTAAPALSASANSSSIPSATERPSNYVRHAIINFRR
jgi:hypothetical protein